MQCFRCAVTASEAVFAVSLLGGDAAVPVWASAALRRLRLCDYVTSLLKIHNDAGAVCIEGGVRYSRLLGFWMQTCLPHRIGEQCYGHELWLRARAVTHRDIDLQVNATV